MFFRPFYVFESGCAAYVLGCGGQGVCAVVDPLERDVDAYIDFAASKGARITHVLETHVHADHRSGGATLARRVGAEYCLHGSAPVVGAFRRLADGDEVVVGNVRLEVLHTPGHSAESICLVVRDLRRGPEPWFVLTGDTLFVGSVGRPDLPGDTEASAHLLYDSIHRKLLTLPAETEIFPAHFSGAPCGVGLSGKPSSTLAFEKRWNPALSMERSAFVAAVSVVPPRPADMEAHVRFNQGQP